MRIRLPRPVVGWRCRRPPVIIGAILAAVVLPACGSSGSAPSGGGSGGANAKEVAKVAAVNLTCKGVKLGGTMTVGVSQDAFSFDPPYTQDNGSLWADMNIYDQLVRLTPDATKLVPGLATSWKIINGGKTYVFHLRKAQFSNGDPVTARDVAFSLERAASPKAFANVGLSIISSTKVVNARTIDVNVKQVSAPFLSDLALWPASVLDEKVLEGWGGEVQGPSDWLRAFLGGVVQTGR